VQLCLHVTSMGYNHNGIVYVIDTANNNIISGVHVEGWPFSIAVNSAGTKIYVTNFDSNSVSVIDTTTNQIIATVPVGINPM